MTNERSVISAINTKTVRTLSLEKNVYTNKNGSLTYHNVSWSFTLNFCFC